MGKVAEPQSQQLESQPVTACSNNDLTHAPAKPRVRSELLNRDWSATREVQNAPRNEATMRMGNSASGSSHWEMIKEVGQLGVRRASCVSVAHVRIFRENADR